MSSVVEFRQVSVSLGEMHLLREITASVKKGERVALVGPSGAGKSTLLSLCSLLRSPTSGEVMVNGMEVREWNVRSLRQKVGMVFQSPTMFSGTVEDNVCYGADLHSRARPDVSSLLSKVGLEEGIRGQVAADLSGGQAQRVALARTLAMNPEVLLLDEVTSALDPHSKQEVERTILDLHRGGETTWLWVTHDLEQARRVADTIWFMEGGRLLEMGSPEALFHAPKTPELQRFISREGDLN